MIEGIMPGQGDVERRDVKLPEFIPDDVVVTVRSDDDVDELPRGSLAHLPEWDEDRAYDLVVAGAGMTFIDRPTYEQLADHEDFDPDGFGVIDDAGMWLPGLEEPYIREEGGWRRPEGLTAEEE